MFTHQQHRGGGDTLQQNQGLHSGFYRYLDHCNRSSYTICPGSLDPFYILNYYIKWVKAYWTCSIILLCPKLFLWLLLFKFTIRSRIHWYCHCFIGVGWCIIHINAPFLLTKSSLNTKVFLSLKSFLPSMQNNTVNIFVLNLAQWLH